MGKQLNKNMKTAIIYDHRNRIGKDGTAPIEVRVTLDGNVFYINTGIRVIPANYVGGTIINQVDAPELNERLATIYKRIQRELNYCITDGRQPDVAAIRRRVWKISEASVDNSFIDYIEEQESIMQLTTGTLRHYTTLRTRLNEFGEIKSWDDVTIENIYKFDAWLHGLKNKKGKNIDDGTVYNYHKCLRAILNRAVLMDRIDRNPYERLKGQFKRGDKESVEYLTEEEMEAIENMHPLKGSKLAIARDLFVFQLHTGLSFADTQAFDFSQYQLINGKYVNIGNRVKTGVQYITQLSDECLEILKRYDYALPKIINHHYNKALKILGEAAGIEKPLHSHLARHSFATRMMASGAPLQNVAKMLGHSKVTQTQRYAKVLVESIMDDFEKLGK